MQLWPKQWWLINMIVKNVEYVENFFVLPNEFCVVRLLFARGMELQVYLINEDFK